MTWDGEALAALGLDDFVAIDLETTGLDPQQETILEFGAVRFVNGEPVDGVAQLLRPEKPLSAFITRLTGITPEEAAYAPEPEAVLPALWARWTAGTLVAHNLEFELAFLNATARRLDLPPLSPERGLDTLLLARTFLPTLYNHRLETVAERLGVPLPQAHRARGDAEAAGRVLLALLERAATHERDVLEQLARLAPPGALQRVLGALLERASAARAGTGYERLARPQVPLSLDLPEGPLHPLDADEVERTLSPQGPLAATLTLEERPQQRAMARRVVEAFNAGRFLVAEAGTGVGKSFAYLIPALAWSRQNPGSAGRVVLSTRTRTLQDQLFHQDLPRLRAALPGGEQDEVVLLKGRQNYLCLRRLETLLQEELPPAERAALMPLVGWLARTRTGDLEELHGLPDRRLRRWVNDDPEYCVGRRCAFYERCYSVHARLRARHAPLVVVNHALLLADLALEGGLLGEYAHLVVDEAHHLEKSTRQALERRVGYGQFAALCDELLREDELGRQVGLLGMLARKVAGRAELTAAIAALDERLRGLRGRLGALFRRLTEQVHAQAGEEALEYTLKVRYGQDTFAALAPEHEALGRQLVALVAGLEGLAERVAEALEREGEALADALTANARNLAQLGEQWDWLFRAEEAGHVFWVELPARAGAWASLHAVPLDVGEPLEALYARLRSAVFTSATLSVAGDFSYFRRRVGLDRLPPERVHAEDFAQPFDHASVVHLAVPTYLPPPGDPAFPAALSELLYEVTTYTRRHTLALFTSYKLLRTVQRTLLERGDPELFVRAQEAGEPRGRVLEAFRHGPPASLLLGTEAFWEGIDLPGKALEIVVLTKLPFPVPHDPLVAAEEERLARLGRSAFSEYSLPQAVLALRQGFGRLIRSQRDRGAVILADVRVVQKAYGKRFLDALPCPAHTHYTSSSLLTALKRFFSQGS